MSFVRCLLKQQSKGLIKLYPVWTNPSKRTITIARMQCKVQEVEDRAIRHNRNIEASCLSNKHDQQAADDTFQKGMQESKLQPRKKTTRERGSAAATAISSRTAWVIELRRIMVGQVADSSSITSYFLLHTDAQSLCSEWENCLLTFLFLFVYSWYT